eukprot:8919116-Pyramimonas_sp.AAC.1
MISEESAPTMCMPTTCAPQVVQPSPHSPHQSVARVSRTGATTFASFWGPTEQPPPEEPTKGARNVTEGARNVTEGARNVTEGARSVTEGARNVTEGARNVTEGARNVIEGARSVTEGARNVIEGARSVTEGARNVTEGARDGRYMRVPGVSAIGVTTAGANPRCRTHGAKESTVQNPRCERIRGAEPT